MTAYRDPVWPRPLLSNGTYELAIWRNGKPVWRRRPWRDNAELIAEVMTLYSPRPSLDLVADVTYGRGSWWSRWSEPCVRHGLDVEGRGEEFDDGVDFRRLPEPAGIFDIVAYDPPYVATGGTATNPDIGDMRTRFGIGARVMPTDPAQLQTEVIDAGLTEVHRVLRAPARGVPGGLALVKCANYISGGHLWPGEYMTLRHAQSLDMALIAAYTFDKAPGPQPRKNRDGSPRVQVNPRNNTSTLYVLERTRPDHRKAL